MLTETSKVVVLNGKNDCQNEKTDKDSGKVEKDHENEKMDVDEETSSKTEIVETKKRRKKEANVAVGVLCSVEFEDPIGWVKGTIIEVAKEEKRKILVRYHKFVEEEWLEIPSNSVRIHNTSSFRVRVENALMDETLVSRSKTVTGYENSRTSFLKKMQFSPEVKALYNKIVWVRQKSFPWWPALVLDPELLFGTGWKMLKSCDSNSTVVVYLGWGDGFVFHKTPILMGNTVVRYTRDKNDEKLRSGYMNPLTSSSTSRKKTKKKKKSISPALKRQLQDVSLPLADDWCRLPEKQVIEGWTEHAGWFLDTRRSCYEKLVEEFTEIITLELERENREYVVIDLQFFFFLHTKQTNTRQIHDDEKRGQTCTFASCESKKGETCNS